MPEPVCVVVRSGVATVPFNSPQTNQQVELSSQLMKGLFELLSEGYSSCQVLSPVGTVETYDRAVLTLGISL